MMPRLLKHQIELFAKKQFRKKRFIPGVTSVPVSGKVFDQEELLTGVEAVLDGWWTEGRFAQIFEKEFGSIVGCRHISLVNSGSSANLIALTSLTSSLLGDRAIKPDDEVISAACGFPTTVNPIIQNRCIPVFVDVDLKTKNAVVRHIQKAISSKTRVIMLAHSLGNPMQLTEILEVVKKYNLWFIEDCCDALGSRYMERPVGTFGHIATYSFYPAHQITMGEGGAVVTNNPLLHKAIRQFRDWGRDCWCDTGKDNTCHNRFGWKMGDLPKGYDHKYIYSQIGYNLKLTDMQAAIGLAQLKKLPSFVKKRRDNFLQYTNFFNKFSEFFSVSEELSGAQASWFGCMILVKKTAPFSRLDMVKYLDSHQIGTRMLFAGNLLKHPAYMNRSDVRVVDSLSNTNEIMERGFWIGVFPGVTEEMISYVCKTITAFVQTF